ncbi:MAG TPA: hypothetical protein VMT20_23040 [Terriglobia bacterium]|nr:hypothetical protein [Terriglobia bacterium]
MGGRKNQPRDFWPASLCALAMTVGICGSGPTAAAQQSTQTAGQTSAGQTTTQVASQASGEKKTSLPAITVWKVNYGGRIHSESVPQDLEAGAEKLGYTLKVETFPADGFAERFFDAFSRNQEPDILAVDNARMIFEIATPSVNFTATSSNASVRQALVQVTESFRGLEDRRGGWEFLLRTSRNYEGAKSLALQAPVCSESLQGSPLSEHLLAVVERAARAYLGGSDPSTTLDDPERLRTETANANSDARAELLGKSRASLDLVRVRLHQIMPCGYWGNDHLAFVPVLSTYESERHLGKLSTLMILRNRREQWRLLAASTDPISNTEFMKQLPTLARLLQKPWTPSSNPVAAKILAPEDGENPEPAAGQRFGDFEWQPSDSGDVVAEIAEFAYKDDARLFMLFPSADASQPERVSAGKLWTSRSTWLWRVWSISDTGAVSFSESRSFPN